MLLFWLYTQAAAQVGSFLPGVHVHTWKSSTTAPVRTWKKAVWIGSFLPGAYDRLAGFAYSLHPFFCKKKKKIKLG